MKKSEQLKCENCHKYKKEFISIKKSKKVREKSGRVIFDERYDQFEVMLCFACHETTEISTFLPTKIKKENK